MKFAHRFNLHKPFILLKYITTYYITYEQKDCTYNKHIKHIHQICIQVLAVRYLSIIICHSLDFLYESLQEYPWKLLRQKTVDQQKGINFFSSHVTCLHYPPREETSLGYHNGRCCTSSLQ